MAIVNRSLDTSEQNHVFSAAFGAVATGLTLNAVIVPFASTLEAVRVAATGISGAPTGLVKVLRFIVGTGSTTLTGGATTLTLTAVGTSGVQSVVLASSGSTFLSLVAGDVIQYTSAGSNAAADSINVSVVLQAIQDIRSSFGVT